MNLSKEIKIARQLLEKVNALEVSSEEKEVLCLALSKLDPKDPVPCGETSYFCPSCDGEVFFTDVHCPWCGQRVEWSEVRD